MIRGARQLLTLRDSRQPRRGAAMGELGIVQDGAVLIRDGLIDQCGPSRRVENLAASRGARVIDATGHVVMPGFVDSHTHLVFGPPRLADYEMRLAGASYQEIEESGGGILSSVEAVRGATQHGLERLARQRLQAMIRHGTTTVEAKSGYALDQNGELKMLRVIAALDQHPLDIAATCLGAHAVPPEYEDRPENYINWLCSDLLPLVRRHGLAQFADVYCEAGAFTAGQARQYLVRAQQSGFGLKIHTDQFSRSGGVRVAVELSAASADHLEQASDEEIALLAKSDTIATLLPGSVFHLGLSRYAPARALIDAGAAVALATDFNPGTSPSFSMPMAMSLACAAMRMSPAEAIVAATVNGAHALRLSDRVGSLETGKSADLLLLNVSDYREIPYYFGTNLVALTMKRGRVLYREAEVLCPED